MSRQLEQVVEERQAKRAKKLVKVLEFELEEAIGRAGADLTGFSIKIGPADCLMTVRGILAGKEQIAFVAGADLGTVLIKCVSEASRDKLRWRPSKYSSD